MSDDGALGLAVQARNLAAIAMGTGAVARGTAIGGESTIAMPQAVPAISPWWVDLVIDGVSQDAGVDFTTDGSKTLTLAASLVAGAKWRVRHIRGTA